MLKPSCSGWHNPLQRIDLDFTQPAEVPYPPAVARHFAGFPAVLRKWRGRAARSKTSAASGVSSASVRRYEEGERLPGVDELDRLLDHFGRDLYDLADELAVERGEVPREQPIPRVAVNLTAADYPGAAPEDVDALLAALQRLMYYEQRREEAQETVNRLRASLRANRA
jgi:transcriptional regulator with XRE-family HTH domain